METCQVCGEEGHDRRTLRLEYFYALEEVSTKFNKLSGHDALYEIRTCKDCRGDFLGVLRRWTAGEFKIRENPEANIPVRVDGRTVMVTEDEYRKMMTSHGGRG